MCGMISCEQHSQLWSQSEAVITPPSHLAARAIAGQSWVPCRCSTHAASHALSLACNASRSPRKHLCSSTQAQDHTPCAGLEHLLTPLVTTACSKPSESASCAQLPMQASSAAPPTPGRLIVSNTSIQVSTGHHTAHCRHSSPAPAQTWPAAAACTPKSTPGPGHSPSCAPLSSPACHALLPHRIRAHPRRVCP